MSGLDSFYKKTRDAYRLNIADYYSEELENAKKTILAAASNGRTHVKYVPLHHGPAERVAHELLKAGFGVVTENLEEHIYIIRWAVSFRPHEAPYY